MRTNRALRAQALERDHQVVMVMRALGFVSGVHRCAHGLWNKTIRHGARAGREGRLRFVAGSRQVPGSFPAASRQLPGSFPAEADSRCLKATFRMRMQIVRGSVLCVKAGQ
jgi:hypothetical protein